MQIPLFQEETHLQMVEHVFGGSDWNVRLFPYYMRSWSLLQHVQPISGTETGYELWEICVTNGQPHGIFWEFRVVFWKRWTSDALPKANSKRLLRIGQKAIFPKRNASSSNEIDLQAAKPRMFHGGYGGHSTLDACQPPSPWF